MSKITLNIAKDFSKNPGSRREWEGLHSGEKFRRDVLMPKFEDAISERKLLEIDLDGTAGYGTSFLEEAFGGLVRELGYDKVRASLTFVSKEEPYLVDDIRHYIEDARKHAHAY